MFGKDIVSLRVLSRTTIGGEETPLFSKSEEVGDFWQRVDVTLSEVRPFQLIVEGVTGTNGPLGDIGLDDTSFTPACLLNNASSLPTGVRPTPSTQSHLFKCKTTDRVVPMSKVCDFRVDCQVAGIYVLPGTY